ncbi:YigZ family protein [bacterium]|nr:YigZ family protein [bacterium]
MGHSIMGQSIVLEEKGSKFLGVTFTINSKEEISGLMKMLKKTKPYSKGTHYMYAYRIEAGSGIDEGKSDDGESGSGINILQVLKTKNASNVITFVIRWYGGKHLGGKRFRLIKQAAVLSLI